MKDTLVFKDEDTECESKKAHLCLSLNKVIDLLTF